MRVKGLEPPRLSAPEPKSGASANFATPAGTGIAYLVFGLVENSRQDFFEPEILSLMELSEVLSRSRQLIRQAQLPTNSAIQLAIDEAAERSGSALDEIELAQEIERELSGYGALQPFLDDPEIEEIWINQPDEVCYFGPRGLRREKVTLGPSQIREIIQRMLKHSNRRLDRLTPYVDADLPDGSRLHVVIPEITRAHWAVNIRKFSAAKFTLADLAETGAMDQHQLDLLSTSVTAGRSILVSGATQAGKTTMLSALLREVGEQQRIISCEDTFELALQHPDWVAMQTRPPRPEGDSEIGLRELVRQALRMRPSWLVIGEVRGAEALDLLVALNSGIPGMCTLHAKSAMGALEKLLTLPLLAGENITDRFLRPTILGAVDLIVHCERLPNGQRRVAQVLEVSSALLD